MLEPEEDAEQEEWHPLLDHGHLLEPEHAGAPPLDEQEGDEPVGGATLSRFMRIAFGDDQRAEGHQQQDEAQPASTRANTHGVYLLTMSM